VRERWLSKRAVSLHMAVLVFVPGCAVAAWWQINRAADGNQLSYLYSVMWPAFAVLGAVFWWVLIHTDYDSAGLKGTRRQQETALVAAAPPVIAGSDAEARTEPLGEDPELDAYNARLAALADKGPKTWRNRERVVVRRAP
jgi:hypothetical protein